MKERQLLAALPRYTIYAWGIIAKKCYLENYFKQNFAVRMTNGQPAESIWF
jgi:hypothetical protein